MRALLIFGFAISLLGQGPAGNYVGELQTPVGKLRLGVVIRSSEGGGLNGELVSIDQGFARIQATSMSAEGKKFQFAASNVGISFEGVLSDDGQSIAGKFQQGMSFDMVFKRVVELPKPLRPQEPKGTPDYSVEEVSFTGGAADVQLSGTLTTPKTSGPHPAVVLVSGSGPQNRDEEIVAHKPFWIWADALTKAGLIVLRYDDRGVSKSTGTFKGATTQDFALDTAAAVDYLLRRKDVDSKRIVVMGHSEGGLIAPMVASKDHSIAAIVLLAGPGVTGEATIRKQIPDLARLAGASEEMTKAQLAAVEAQARTEPWMKYFWSYDPAIALAKVKCPVLALNGELDMQVNADIHLAAIEAALKQGKNQNYTTKKLAKLNHLFQTAQTGAGQEYARLEETLSPVVINEVTAWLKKTLSMK